MDTTSAKNLRSVSIHEISHAFAGVGRSAIIGLALDRVPLSDTLWTGRVICDFNDDSKFHDSVYGWAGIVGEAIDHDRTNAVRYAFDRYEHQRSSISATDLASIEGVAPDARLNTAEAAYEILVGRWAEVKALQDRILTVIENDGESGVLFVWKKESGWVKM
jgi:hypothetical protein